MLFRSLARSCLEQPGAAKTVARSSQPEAVRSSQNKPGAARQLGAAMASLEQPGETRSSQGQPEAARSSQEHSEEHPRRSQQKPGWEEPNDPDAGLRVIHYKQSKHPWPCGSLSAYGNPNFVYLLEWALPHSSCLKAYIRMRGAWPSRASALVSGARSRL